MQVKLHKETLVFLVVRGFYYRLVSHSVSHAFQFILSKITQKYYSKDLTKKIKQPNYNLKEMILIKPKRPFNLHKKMALKYNGSKYVFLGQPFSYMIILFQLEHLSLILVLVSENYKFARDSL